MRVWYAEHFSEISGTRFCQPALRLAGIGLILAP